MHKFSPSSTEKLADLLFEIGRDQSKKLSHQKAVIWLERAHDVFISQSLDALDSDEGELFFSIKQVLVKSYLALQGDENMIKARNMINGSEMTYGNKLAYLLLKLDLFDSDPSSPAEDYCNVLQRIARTVHLTNSNLKTMLHHIYKLRNRSQRMAHVTLETLLSERLSHIKEPQWTEKILITMIWNCTTSTDLVEALAQLSRILDVLYADSAMVISSSATHAAQVVRAFGHQTRSFPPYIADENPASVEVYRSKFQSGKLCQRRSLVQSIPA